MELAGFDYAEDDAESEAGAYSVGRPSGDEDEYEDVDDIVDPLAGLRNEHTERFDRGGERRGRRWRISVAASRNRSTCPRKRARTPAWMAALLQPKRRRPLVSGESGSGAQTPPGNTLFERMANLSRGSAPATSDADDEDEDDDEGGPTLNIPRFLGRQNNQ